MVKIHLVRRKPPAAVAARNVSELAQECGRRLLPAADPVDLALAIRRVVLDILRALVAARRHAQE
jgi:hypothetical protein